MDCCNVASCIKVNSSINEVVAKKEYVNVNVDMIDTDNHTAVFKTVQAGTYKIYIYNALGIPKKNINYNKVLKKDEKFNFSPLSFMPL